MKKKKPIKPSPKKDKLKKAKEQKHKVRNWKEYNENLARRGSLEFWIEQGWIKSWKVTVVKDGTLSRGRQCTYADHAIETVLMLGKVFRQPLRQAEVFCRSVFKMAGPQPEQVTEEIDIPDYTTVSRRGKSLKVTLPLDTKDKVIALYRPQGLWRRRMESQTTWNQQTKNLDQDAHLCR